MLQTKWLLGIDLILQAFSVAKDKLVPKFFCNMVDQAGDTFAWIVPGPRVWATTNPENVDNMIESLPANGPVDLQPLFFRLTMDSATAFLFGKSADSLKPDQAEDAKRFTEAFQFAQGCIKKRYQFGRHCWLMNSRKYQSACRTVHDFVDRMALRAIKDRRNGITPCGGTETTNLLDSLVCETQDPVELRSHLLHSLMSGMDTTTTLLSWTM
jgi:cytochrome P450